MNIPKLDRVDRSREYEIYSFIQRANVIWAFLSQGATHRNLDEEILGLDSIKSKGWQSMGILHFLGLKRQFQGLFRGIQLGKAIEELKRSNNDDYSLIISHLQMLSDSESTIVNDIEIEISTDYRVLVEGQIVKYFTTRYERNPENRAAAIRIHGVKCMACGFDFEKMYGERGKSYIEVHHRIPISAREEEVAIDPKTDLVVVCSNCHRMIHRKKDAVLSLEQLREIISENKE